MKQLLTILVLFGTFVMHAQDIELTDLQAPNSPAFTIIDVEPQAISKPNSFQKLRTEVSNLIDEDGKLVPDVAIEIMPYWLFKKQDSLTASDYLFPNTWQKISQSSSFSIATADVSTDEVLGTKVGLGYRVNLIGSPNVDKVDLDAMCYNDMLELLTESIIQEVDNLGNEIDHLSRKSKSELDTVKLNTNSWIREKLIKIHIEVANNFDEADPSCKYLNKPFTEKSTDTTSFMDDIIEIVFEENTIEWEVWVDKLETQKLSQLKEAILDYYIEKIEGLRKEEHLEQLENTNGLVLSTAIGLSFPENEIENMQYYKFGAWLTYSHNLGKSEEGNLNIMARYLNEQVIDTTNQKLDLGAQINYQPKKANGEAGNFILSLEALGRLNMESRPDSSLTAFDYRVDVMAKYIISDYFDVKMTLGKNFNDNRWIQGNLLAVLGIDIKMPFRQSFTRDDVKSAYEIQKY